jgi:DNA-binding SARP family transcriptional activator
MAHLTISLLGPFRVALGGEPITAFESDKVRALLAYLAVETDRPHRRETLAGLLWPEWPERSARHNLSQALSNLRRAIGGSDAAFPFFLVSQQTIQFNADSDHTLDATTVATLLEDCKGHDHDDAETCDQCMDRLQKAVALYEGDFLEGFSLGDSPAFEEWAILQRERLHRLGLDALSRLVGCYERRGHLEQALRHARRWLELDPWQERAHRQVMRLLARSGQRNAALKQYRICRRTLADELGVEPSERTTELFEQIRDGKYGRPELPRQKRDTRDKNASQSKPARLLALVVLLALFLVLGFDLLPGFLRLGPNQTLIYSCADQTDIPETECQALATLYNETGGADWKDSSGWLSDSTPCSWFGVTCDRGQVAELNLPDNNLSGTIPPEISLLTYLWVLELQYNQLSGSIPPELGSLSNLRHLSLHGNSQLSGPIPPELGNLIRLEWLSLSSHMDGGTQLSGPIPPELGNLKRLTHLDISNSLLSGPIPPELGNLTNLVHFSLVQNPLSGPVPPELGNLVNLTTLAVGEGYSELEGPLPLSLMNLKKLEYFTYAENTNLCAPPDAEFQEWLDGIPEFDGPRVVCPSEE